jgi:hypothetical protein
MFFRTAADKRPYHYGPFPLETLPRDASVAAAEAALPPVTQKPHGAAPSGAFGQALRTYLEIFKSQVNPEVAPRRAPVPDDTDRRTMDVKGYAYFLNASQAGICRIPESAWVAGVERPDHRHAVVLLVEHGRIPESDNPAREWVSPAVKEAGDIRAGEIAVCVARHIAKLGFPSRAHVAGNGLLDAERLAVLAGLVVRDGATLRNPFIDTGFSLAVVSTEYALTEDRPLAAGTVDARGLRYWLGLNGATSGRERNRCAKRPTHYSKYPMEQVRRVDRPTTLILDDEVPRVSKRAGFFDRALRGDLGEKTQAERSRFAFKQPHSAGMMAPMLAMVPIQGGAAATNSDTARYGDPAANSRALKSLSYFLGSDLTGICEIPRYAWYSHDADGNPIEMKHKYAVVMLIDQEYDTMEGASGDDWISGAQSMRGYLRGAEIPSCHRSRTIHTGSALVPR